MDTSQPQRVRTSAGQIISALSLSGQGCAEICDVFWAKFAKLKKDDDFRNFTCWVNGVVGLHLSLASPPIAKTSIGFLQKFVGNSKRIERGVLQQRFLEAIVAMFGRINTEPGVSRNHDYMKVLHDIWILV
jgi:hypothetical protein